MAHPFERLLLATEHTEFDRGAETIAFALAARCGLPLAAVLPLVSNAAYEAEMPALAARADAEAGARADALEAEAARAGVALALRVRRGEEPFEQIVAEARERGADLIVARRRGRRGFLAQLMFGEMVGKVVAHAPCSVLLCPRAAAMWQRRVLVGVDPQASAAGSVELAARIAAACGIGLQVVAVAEGKGAHAAAASALAAAVARAAPLVADVAGEFRTGRPHEGLIAAATACSADLIVVDRHVQPLPGRAWIGGTTQKVIGLAEGPVLVHVPSAAGAP
ncbi:MAG TPA: universal stress protein [Rubrivivax sp.]|nr:universal stress protein [Rubrivivax sp.]